VLHSQRILGSFSLSFHFLLFPLFPYFFRPFLYSFSFLPYFYFTFHRSPLKHSAHIFACGRTSYFSIANRNAPLRHIQERQHGIKLHDQKMIVNSAKFLFIFSITLLLACLLGLSSTLKKETLCSSETSINLIRLHGVTYSS
jgi:hypothetical protein